MPKFEGREIREDSGLSHKFSVIAKCPVKIYVDYHPKVGRQLLLFYKGRFNMRLLKDDGPNRKWVYDHFQKVRSQWYKKYSRKLEIEPKDREVEKEEDAEQEDWERFLDDAADYAFNGRVSVTV